LLSLTYDNLFLYSTPSFQRMKVLLLIGTGGFFGSIARYLAQQGMGKILPVIFPFGTFAVNIVGCFLIGVIYALSDRSNLLTAEWRFFLASGFCGGFTTFSTFSVEAYDLMRQEQYLYLSLYVGLSVVLGILATAIAVALFSR